MSRGPESDEALRILFVLQDDFSAPTEQQAFGFAQELASLGHRVLLSTFGDPTSHERQGLSLEPGLEVRRHGFRGPLLSRDAVAHARQFAPTLIHAWNPRPLNISAARSYQRATGAPYVVHFEDDEFSPWPVRPRGARAKVSLTGRRLLWRLHPPWWFATTPLTRRWVRREAGGVEAIVPSLAREVESRLGRECSLMLPVLPRRPETQGQSLISRGDGEQTVLFAGRVMANSLPDFMHAIEGVALLRRRGVAARLVQAGRVEDGIDLSAFAHSVGLEESALQLLGHVSYADLTATVEAADVLVQSGPPSRFNSYRLPAKIGLYLESGVPTVTFAGGLAELVQDREEVLMTYTADPAELADRLGEALTDGALRSRLIEGAGHAAARLFDRSRNTQTLLDFYAQSLARARSREAVS